MRSGNINWQTALSMKKTVRFISQLGGWHWWERAGTKKRSRWANKAVRLSPTAPTYRILGEAAALDGDIAQALDLLDKGEKSDPAYEPIYIARGNILMALNRNAQACAAFQKAWTLDPQDPSAAKGLALTAPCAGRAYDASSSDRHKRTLHDPRWCRRHGDLFACAARRARSYRRLPHRFFVFINAETDAGLAPESARFEVDPDGRTGDEPAAAPGLGAIGVAGQTPEARIDVLLNPGYTMPVLAPARWSRCFTISSTRGIRNISAGSICPSGEGFCTRRRVAARLIIAVSEATRQDFIAHYKVDASRVRVVHHGVDAGIFRNPCSDIRVTGHSAIS